MLLGVRSIGPFGTDKVLIGVWAFISFGSGHLYAIFHKSHYSYSWYWITNNAIFFKGTICNRTRKRQIAPTISDEAPFDMLLFDWLLGHIYVWSCIRCIIDMQIAFIPKGKTVTHLLVSFSCGHNWSCISEIAPFM